MIRSESQPRRTAAAFSLIELLVVLGVLSVLLGLLVPVLGQARSQARGVVCQAQLRQLVLANLAYAQEFEHHLVPAAADLWDRSGLQRWHGRRPDRQAPFDPNGSPLAAYLAEGRLKRCPEPVAFRQDGSWSQRFESGAGGYGYNLTYLGSRLWDPRWANQPPEAFARTASLAEVAQPAATLMFADTALSQDGEHLIEYSFAEPPYAVFGSEVYTAVLMSPSIHFRHGGWANIGWTDGHVDSRRPLPNDRLNVYGVRSQDLGLGWFGALNNSLFDLK